MMVSGSEIRATPVVPRLLELIRYRNEYALALTPDDGCPGAFRRRLDANMEAAALMQACARVTRAQILAETESQLFRTLLRNAPPHSVPWAPVGVCFTPSGLALTPTSTGSFNIGPVTVGVTATSPTTINICSPDWAVNLRSTKMRATMPKDRTYCMRHKSYGIGAAYWSTERNTYMYALGNGAEGAIAEDEIESWLDSQGRWTEHIISEQWLVRWASDSKRFASRDAAVDYIAKRLETQDCVYLDKVE